MGKVLSNKGQVTGRKSEKYQVSGNKIGSWLNFLVPWNLLLSFDRSCDVLGLAAGAEIKDGHAHGDPVGDLLKDDAAGGIGERTVDFDAAIDRAGMHDDGVGLDPRGSSLVEAEHAGVFAD